MEFIKINFWFITAIAGGIFVSIISAKDFSPRMTLLRVSCGAFGAWFFTDPLLDFFKLDPDVYANATAGLLAMTGHNLVKFITDLNVEKIITLYKTFKGGK
jgi:hypothetical protein